jgi:magnesium chelatase family protein
LAPADLRKEGPSFDLPIAIGILIASGQVLAEIDEAVFLGELSLDGGLRHTHGILPMTGFARDSGNTSVFVPEVDAPEATLVEGIRVYPVPTLRALAAHLNQETALQEADHTSIAGAEIEQWSGTDLSEVRGQEHVKRALEVATAGGHNIVRQVLRAPERRSWHGRCRELCRASRLTNASR